MCGWHRGPWNCAPPCAASCSGFRSLRRHTNNTVSESLTRIRCRLLRLRVYTLRTSRCSVRRRLWKIGCGCRTLRMLRLLSLVVVVSRGCGLTVVGPADWSDFGAERDLRFGVAAVERVNQKFVWHRGHAYLLCGRRRRLTRFLRLSHLYYLFIFDCSPATITLINTPKKYSKLSKVMTLQLKLLLELSTD